MLDVIDALDPQFATQEADDEVSEEDRRYAAELLAHMRSCETCAVAVRQARAMRDMQRKALFEILDEGASQVPSSVDSIIFALRREHAAHGAGLVNSDTATSTPSSLPQTPAAFATHDAVEQPILGDVKESSVVRPQSGNRRPLTSAAAFSMRRNARLKKGAGYAFALVAAAALILVATQILHMHSGTFSTSGGTASSAAGSSNAANSSAKSNMKQPAYAPAAAATWSSLLLVQQAADGRSQLVENYDPTTGHSTLLQTIAADAQVDSVSYHGDNLAYHEFDNASQQTTYHLLYGSAIPFNGKGTNAVWSVDDSSIFVVTDADTIWRVAVSNMQAVALPSHIQADKLLMVRGPFLYYVQGHALWRVNVMASQAQVPQVVVASSSSTTFWIDPWTEDVYYYLAGTNGTHDIYAISSDPNSQSNPRLIATNATMIGYSQDQSLVIMIYKQSSNHFELDKITNKQTGETPQPLSSNVIDGARALCQSASVPNGTVCDSSVALSPLGTRLIVGASDPGHRYQVQSFTVAPFHADRVLLTTNQPVTLIGWDKLIVP